MPLPSLTRRKLLGLAAATAVAGLGADSLLFEPNRPRVVRHSIRLRRWPEALNGFKIALISDFHYDARFSVHPIHAAIRIINELRADLIALAGDFVSMALFDGDDQKAAAAAEPCARLLGQMRARYGAVAVMGNHDFFTDPFHVTAALRSEGIRVLANEAVPIEVNTGRFWLAGVNDVESGTADLDRTLRQVQQREPTILLAHEPDFADEAARYSIDLQLSGHSHGGQVRLPWFGPLYLPALARKYIWGLYQIRGLTLYTNPGLGTVGIPVRWNCPPEITLLTLEAGMALR